MGSSGPLPISGGCNWCFGEIDPGAGRFFGYFPLEPDFPPGTIFANPVLEAVREDGEVFFFDLLDVTDQSEWEPGNFVQIEVDVDPSELIDANVRLIMEVTPPPGSEQDPGIQFAPFPVKVL